MDSSTQAPVARKASTVIVLRVISGRLEVFMIQRNRKTGFMPNAWVFPGVALTQKTQIVRFPRKAVRAHVLKWDCLEKKDNRFWWLRFVKHLRKQEYGLVMA